MAFKKDLAQRLFNACRFGRPDCRISTSSVAVKTRIPPGPEKIAPDPGDDGIFRRFIHRRAAAEILSFPIGERLVENLRGISRDRIRLDGLIPPAAPAKPDPDSSAGGNLSVLDARKVLQLAQIEMVKSKLAAMEMDRVSYSEFLRICGEFCYGNGQSEDLAKILDDSGTVIVLGDVVFLKPHQVVKAIQGLIPVSSDPMREELAEMEKQKAVIDRKAKSLVRRELWGGLGYMVIQTAAFMRLTFWELSWDVMEPICFYVTSVYCMAGYAFFLRTSIEPSFEGFFQSRFIAKQKKLMKLHGFDISRYNELKKACCPLPPATAKENPISISS